MSKYWQEILLSKAQLGQEIDLSSLTDNQRLRLESLKSELQSRLDAAKNLVNASDFQYQAIQSLSMLRRNLFLFVNLYFPI